LDPKNDIEHKNWVKNTKTHKKDKNQGGYETKYRKNLLKK